MDDGAAPPGHRTHGVDTVVVCEPRGFCAGVEMAIKSLGWMLRIFEPPVYCYHEIVHNRLVVEVFEAAGVVFVDDVAAVPPGSPLMLSAHGSAPEVVAGARARGGVVVDAVCPLVTKVHHEARKRAAAGYDIIYVGHAGHDEAIGAMAEAPESMHLVEKASDLDSLEVADAEAVALLAQTTLAHSEWSEILDAARDRFPDLWTPSRSDLCFATTNRQAAVRAVAADCDLVLVIGSENSSNTQALVRTARQAGAPASVRIDGPDDVDATLLEGARCVAVTAGASAPESVVSAVVARLAPRTVEFRRVTEEDEYFPLPRELRELVRALDVVVGATTGRSGGRGGGDLDSRSQTAAGILAAIELP